MIHFTSIVYSYTLCSASYVFCLCYCAIFFYLVCGSPWKKREICVLLYCVHSIFQLCSGGGGGGGGGGGEVPGVPPLSILTLFRSHTHAVLVTILTMTLATLSSLPCLLLAWSTICMAASDSSSPLSCLLSCWSCNISASCLFLPRLGVFRDASCFSLIFSNSS